MFVFQTSIMAQDCDAATNGLQLISPPSGQVSPGQFLSLKFRVRNQGSDASCSYPPEFVEVSFSLPAHMNFDQILSVIPLNGAPNPHFNWAYNPATRVITAVNTVSLDNLDGDEISLRFVATTPPSYPSTQTFQLTLFVDGDDNNLFNDEADLSATIVAPAPVTMDYMNGYSRECKEINLNWKTSAELNNDFFEILRSADGKEYLSIGTVKGANSVRGSQYEFVDRNYLIPGNMYYYRIRQVDFDGRSESFDVFSVKHTCEGALPGITVFPNPAVNKTNITVTGITQTNDVELHLFNSDGSMMRKIFVSPSQTMEMEVLDLPAGVYQLKTVNTEAPLSARFIRIE